jgi:hypothetical protein
MINQAKYIWKYAKTAYKPAEKPMDSVSLGDDVDLTGRQISRFSYKGAEQPVGTWAETYRKVIDYVKSKVRHVKIIGLTATPFRTAESEQGLLSKIYKDGRNKKV